MTEEPDTPNYEFSQTVHDKPYWMNNPTVCRYFSEVGILLGYIQLGEGLARNLWFSYIGLTYIPITPGGRLDREAAKSDVMRMVEIDVCLMVAEQEYRDEQRGRR